MSDYWIKRANDLLVQVEKLEKRVSTLEKQLGHRLGWNLDKKQVSGYDLGVVGKVLKRKK